MVKKINWLGYIIIFFVAISVLKIYFDTDLLGTYVAVGYQYRFFTLYSYSYNFSLEKQIKTV